MARHRSQLVLGWRGASRRPWRVSDVCVVCSERRRSATARESGSAGSVKPGRAVEYILDEDVKWRVDLYFDLKAGSHASRVGGGV